LRDARTGRHDLGGNLGCHDPHCGVRPDKRADSPGRDAPAPDDEDVTPGDVEEEREAGHASIVVS
jgi:hypothetical protein